MSSPRTPRRTSDSTAVSRLMRQEVKATLARWLLRRRREGGAGGGPQTHDEATHPWDGRRRFGEDYTFAAAQKGLGIVVRLEWLPGRDAHRVWVVLLREGEVVTLPQGQRIVRAHSTDRWSAAGLQLDCMMPLKRWSLRFAGPLAVYPPGSLESRESPESRRRTGFDLTFVAEQPPFTPGVDDDPELLARRFGEAAWDRALVRAVRRAQNRGYVQSGALVGTVSLGDAIIPVHAGCVRQHTWGVRDWAASDEAFQCFMATRAGARLWVQRARFPFLTLEGGFLAEPRQVVDAAASGLVRPVRALGTTLERRPGRAPGNVTVSVTHGEGQRIFEARTVSDASFTVDGRGTLDLALLELGDGSGYGLWAGQHRLLPRPQRVLAGT